MGYVTASFSYRLGIDNLFDFQTSFVEAVWRGVHDSRAAVRYFRKSVEMGNPYHIDPERIYLGGVSAGGFIAMHHAYVDEESEIPTYIDESEPGLGGGLEGPFWKRGLQQRHPRRVQHRRRASDRRLFALGRQRTACEHPWHGRRNGALRRG